MFVPGVAQIAEDLNTSTHTVVGATTGFVVSLGIGPLILAPLSETFGRRKLYLMCFSIFAFLQIPTALSPNIEALIAVRSVSGFFGSKVHHVPSSSWLLTENQALVLLMEVALSAICSIQVNERTLSTSCSFVDSSS